MTKYKTGLVTVTVDYGYDLHSIQFSKRTYDRIKRGNVVTIRGQGFHREGVIEADYWVFNSVEVGAVDVDTIYSGHVNDGSVWINIEEDGAENRDKLGGPTPQKILTDLTDGIFAVHPLIRSDGRWEFVVSGTGTETPGEQWKCSFDVQFPDRYISVCALRLTDFGDPINNNGPDPIVNIVAVWPDHPDRDKNWLVCKLLFEYKKIGGKFVERSSTVGQFDLEDYWQAI